MTRRLEQYQLAPDLARILDLAARPSTISQAMQKQLREYVTRRPEKDDTFKSPPPGPIGPDWWW